MKRMSISRSLRCILFSLLASLFTTFAISARADEPVNHQVWRFLTGPGNTVYLVAGVGLPLIEDGRAGRNHALRSADALGTSVLLSEGFQTVVPREAT